MARCCVCFYGIKSHFWNSWLLTIFLDAAKKSVKIEEVFFSFWQAFSRRRLKVQDHQTADRIRRVHVGDATVPSAWFAWPTPLPPCPPPPPNTLIPSALSYNCGNNGSRERGSTLLSTWFGQNGEFLLTLQTYQPTYNMKHQTLFYKNVQTNYCK
jgi:hypothetical protein